MARVGHDSSAQYPIATVDEFVFDRGIFLLDSREDHATT
jgi:hypothetical protein